MNRSSTARVFGRGALLGVLISGGIAGSIALPPIPLVVVAAAILAVGAGIAFVSLRRAVGFGDH